MSQHKGGRQLSETVKEFPGLYDKVAKGYKEKDAGKAATRGALCKKVFYVKKVFLEI